MRKGKGNVGKGRRRGGEEWGIFGFGLGWRGGWWDIENVLEREREREKKVNDGLWMFFLVI